MLDEHRPERPVLLAVNQEFGEGPLPLNVPEGYKQQARRFAPEVVSLKEGRQDSLGNEWKGSGQGIKVT